jgi:hypothetical protein
MHRPWANVLTGSQQSSGRRKFQTGAHSSKNRDEIVLALNRALLSYYATSRNTGLANQVMYKNMLSALDDDAKKPEENTASSDTHDNTRP